MGGKRVERDTLRGQYFVLCCSCCLFVVVLLLFVVIWPPIFVRHCTKKNVCGNFVYLLFQRLFFLSKKMGDG